MTTQLLSLTRAARLAGVNRAELQRRIRRGEIQTFEGQVAAGELLRVFPQTDLSDDKEFDRVERIKADAIPKQYDRDVTLPSPEVLVSRLRSISELLSSKLATLDAAVTLLDQTTTRLAEIAEEAPAPLDERLGATLAWLTNARDNLAAEPRADGQSRLLAKDTFLRIMAANVKIIPSGHEFFVEGTESILEASVRAGLNMSYGCSSGNCGSCKARVVSGEVHRIREHDYVLSEREKQMGYFLACSNTAVTDVVLEAAEALTVADLPEQEIRASVRKVERPTGDLAVLHIQTPRTHTLRFMAGQRVHLTLENGATRELHIASCPCNGRNLQFFVEGRPADPFAEAVFAGLRHGQLVEVKGPTGSFVLHEEASDPAVFVAFDQGMAPIKSLIEHAVSIDVIEAFHLYWIVARPERHHLDQWGRSLRDALDNFHITPMVGERPEDVLIMLEADLPDAAAPRYYLAGTEDQVGPILAGLTARGVDPERIRTERLD